ncbi:MAG: dTDP-4-dehydrorhamnose reductase [Hyphomicrobiales bacterium]|jgi:dTDP-4-dehydrorhamnose reductase|nr:dTDP-4-dehydrorhamnose reductase [Hyphomicrobiales bacterium]
MKAIVIGMDGLIGGALAQAIRAEGGQVHGTSRRADAAASGLQRLDLAEPNPGDVGLPSADVAFFCAAMVRFAECRANPRLARQINVVAPAALARRLAAQGTRPILLSTSAVYDGRAARVLSSEPPRPVTDYGRLKAEAEAEFLALGEGASVVRLTKVLAPRQPIFIRWIEALSRGESVTAFSDLGLAPVSLAAAIRGLSAIATQGEGGIFQVSAASDIAYAEAARHVAGRVGADRKLVVSQRGVDAGMPPEQMTLLSSLDASRLATLTGEGAPDPFDVIDEVFGAEMKQARGQTVSQ